MTDHPSEQEDVAERLRALEQAKSAAADACHFRTAVNAGQETRRLARREHLLIPYLQGTFTVMNYSLELLDPSQQRDMALELISLLEDDARPRQFQPALPGEA